MSRARTVCIRTSGHIEVSKRVKDQLEVVEYE